MRRVVWMLGWLVFLVPLTAPAQKVSLDSVRIGDTTVVHALRLADGSTLVGRVVHVDADSVRLTMRTGTMTVARSLVVEARQASTTRLRNGEYWFENPTASRLLIVPTAIPLERGEGSFSDIYLLFLNGQVGVTDRLSIGAGLSVIPADDFSDNLFYVTPKLTVLSRPSLKLALGAFIGYLGLLADDGDEASMGFVYGVGTGGDDDTNLSVGLGWGYQGGDLMNQPLGMLGLQTRFSRRVAFISENWVAQDNGRTRIIFSYGLRFLSERLGVDLAFANWNDADSFHFPGIPFVGFAVKF